MRARRKPPGPTYWRAAAEDGLARVVAGGAAAYDRRRALPRLIGCDPGELDRDGAAGERRVKARLMRALRAERRRGRAGHWAYDLDRHLALLQALAGEAARASRSPAEARKNSSS